MPTRIFAYGKDSKIPKPACAFWPVTIRIFACKEDSKMARTASAFSPITIRIFQYLEDSQIWGQADGRLYFGGGARGEVLHADPTDLCRSCLGALPPRAEHAPVNT